jgi:hypothetical protein
MKFKPLTTSKLFYNKWPYKIECIQQGASRMYRDPTGTPVDWLLNRSYYWSTPPVVDNEDKEKIANFYSNVKALFDSEDCKIRVEGSHFNIFLKDKAMLDVLTVKLDPWVRAIYGPSNDEELGFIINNGHKKRVCAAYPKEKYQYRIYIRERMKIDLRESFYAWTQKYGNKIDMPLATKRWLSGERAWAQNPYIYLEGGPMLTMTSLFLGENVRIIEEFILRSSINTGS